MSNRMHRGRLEFWPRQLVKKWLSVRRSGNHQFNHDHEMDMDSEFEDDDDREAFEAENRADIKELESRLSELATVTETAPKNSSYSLLRGQSETLRQQFVEDREFRISVGTWNVAGKPPPDDLDLEDWLDTTQPADIYVLGFQEIVPLNAGNVLCVEDEGPAARWESLIRHTLNSKMGQYKEEGQPKSYSAPSSPWREDDLSDEVPQVSHVESLVESIPKEEEVTSSSRKRQLKKSSSGRIPEEMFRSLTRQVSTSCGWIDEEFTDESAIMAPLFSSGMLSSHSNQRQNHYSRIASKQMVGIFISVWVRSDLRRHVHNLKVSCVGCGIMGYLGNKGSISVSMSLHQTSFCFVCAHLTSGHKEGDELRRNADVAEILRRTRFPRLVKFSGIELPETILAHDRIIWLGDLNYRLSLSNREAWKAISCSDWEALLQRDQLKLEQTAGRVFEGWHEGSISFPPTYKFVANSDEYFRETVKPGEKRRTPAWCDRILWYGKGLREVAYTGRESKLSDHRPVNATFMAEAEVVSWRKLKKACTLTKNAKVEVEELLPPIVDVLKIQCHEVTCTTPAPNWLQHHDTYEEAPEDGVPSRGPSNILSRRWMSTEQPSKGCKNTGDRVKGRKASAIDQFDLLSVY